MTKPKKILLISFIVIIVLWFGGNLGLYLFAKHFLIGEDRLELFDKVPEIIEVKYKETEGRKIYFGDLELTLPFIDFTPIDTNPYVHIYKNQDKNYFISLTVYYKYGVERKTLMIHLWNPDEKMTERYIQSSQYTFDDYSRWNTAHNIKSLDLLLSKWMFLPSDNDTKKQPQIVNTQYLKGFWSPSYDNKWNISSFDFSNDRKSYSMMLIGFSEQEILNNINNIISSIKPIEDKEKVAKELLLNYKNDESLIDRELALISLISIEGPSIENLSELKNLLIQKDARKENIEEIQAQIDILRGNANKVTN